MKTQPKVYHPQQLSPKTLSFLREDKHPSKKDFIDRIMGRTVKRMPTWEAGVDQQPFSTILEKPMVVKYSQAEPEDCVELCRRTGIAGVGLGIYYSPCRGTHLLQSRQGFEQVMKEEKPDFTAQFDRLKCLQDATGGTDIGAWAYTHGPFDPVYLGMDMEEFWLLIADDPEYLIEVGDYLLEINCGIVDRLVACGVDWIHIGDDVAFKSGLIAPPDFFFEYYAPRLKRQIEPAKKAGLPVTFHSDGKVDMIIDMLVECGLDAMHPMEPYSNDPYEIARLAAGRIGLMGNIEFATMSPEKAKERTCSMIDKMGPRYVPASSHSLTNDVSIETYVAFLRCLQ
jgi:hypothetical protein